MKVSKKTEAFEDAMFDAFEDNRYKILEELMQTYGPKATDRDGRNLVLNAVIENKNAFAIKLLDAGIDPDQKDKNGYTALHFAVQEGNEKLVSELLKRKVAVNPKTKEGNTPIWKAVMTNKPKLPIIRALLAAGANPTIKNKFKVSAVDLAEGEPKLIELFEKRKKAS